MALPTIQRRRTWTPTPAPGGRLRHPISLVVAHCSVVPDLTSTDPKKEIAAMQAIDRAHKANGWAGFGYNFAGTDDGSVYEGRGWSKTGAHASGFNDTALGYCWLINGDKRPPTKAAWDAFAGFLLLGLSARVIHKDFWLVGHRRINSQGKSCPGFQTSDQELADLQRWVKAIYANSLKGK